MNMTYKNRNTIMYIILVIGIPMFIALCLLLYLHSLNLTISVNVGHAMEPTIKDREIMVINRKIKHISRGDIIAFHPPHRPEVSYVKRIVGLPSEKVSVESGHVFINGKRLEEPYLDDKNIEPDHMDQRGIPMDAFFVLGDNRKNSSDSRHWGDVPRNLIKGKIVF